MLRRLAETSQVKRNDVVVLGELGDDRIPRLTAVTDAVNQDEGFTAALAGEGEFGVHDTDDVTSVLSV